MAEPAGWIVLGRLNGTPAALQLDAAGEERARTPLTDETVAAWVADAEAATAPRWVWNDASTWYPRLLAAGVGVGRGLGRRGRRRRGPVRPRRCRDAHRRPRRAGRRGRGVPPPARCGRPRDRSGEAASSPGRRVGRSARRRRAAGGGPAVGPCRPRPHPRRRAGGAPARGRSAPRAPGCRGPRPPRARRPDSEPGFAAEAAAG